MAREEAAVETKVSMSGWNREHPGGVAVHMGLIPVAFPEMAARDEASGPDMAEAAELRVEANTRRDTMASPSPGMKREAAYMAPEIKRKARRA